MVLRNQVFLVSQQEKKTCSRGEKKCKSDPSDSEAKFGNKDVKKESVEDDSKGRGDERAHSDLNAVHKLALQVAVAEESRRGDHPAAVSASVLAYFWF